MAGSSSSAAVSLLPVIRHHVFLNFRGEDTRDNFISHIYEQLQRKKIETYIDYRLSRGQEISPALHRAIEESMIYVVVFSENYASSTWCLDELTKILDCKKRYGRDVIPVFYKVAPSIVRYQIEKYAEEFVKHEHRFKDKIDKVHAWKAALTEAAGLSGWDSQVTRPEATLVAEIVKDILEKLDSSSISDHQGIVGIENHITRIQSLMNLESPDIRIIGIWGLGGIGKTTIAKQIYHKLASQFGSSSLVLNVQEEIQRHGIQKQIKVLLILDDVNDSGKLKDLIAGRGDFGEGSRIILTSRDMQVLKNAEADEIYEVKEMNFQNSLNLFSIHAFHQNYPRETYMGLSIKVLHYAKGIPLALQILGSLLYGRTKAAWESELQKLEKLPNPKIFNVLKLSYDGLDEEQKNIFLDIACFFRGHGEIVVAQKLESCGFSATIGMDVLKDKCLISTLEGKIEMHDLIQEMGQEIVRQECPLNPGKRSRLWKVEEIHQVLKNNKGTDAVQCILLDTCKINGVKLHSKAFEKMENLRMLHFESYDRWSKSNVVQLALSLESLPDGLKFLLWDGFPQRSLPQNYWPQNLVRLEMRNCHLEQLWEPDRELPKLKRLDLSYSRKLIRIDLYMSPDIEEILLVGCKSLTEVYSSGFLNKLNCLCLNGCDELRSLSIPSNILWRSSGLILVSGCDKLETFSISIRTEVVQLSGCSHHDIFPTGKGWYCQEYPRFCVGDTVPLPYALPSRVLRTFDPVVNIDRHEVEDKEEKKEELCCLDLSNCDSLTSLSFEFDLSKLKFLNKLLLNGCFNFKIFPEIEDTMENLAVLKLDRTAIQALPSSLCRLVALEELSLHYCKRLETIPASIGDLSKLCKLGLTYCVSLETFPSSIFKLKLTELDLSGCSKLRTFPEILEPAQTSAHVYLTETAIKELPFSFGNLVQLQTLRLNMCTDLESLPNSIFKLKLTELDLSGCSKLRTFPEILEPTQNFAHVTLTGTAIKELPFSFGNLVQLQTLRLNMCTDLESLPNSIFKLKLTKLDLSGCSKLRTFPEILEPTQNFAHVTLTGTAIKELPFSFGNLVQLQTLRLNMCTDLESLPNDIVNLNLLSVLDCSGCAKLTEIPNNIGRLSLLRELSLSESGIVNLPESIAHLSSLELLDLTECKKLECIPRLPAFLKQLLAFDCQSITRVMSNSLIQIPSNSKEGGIFRFYFTNGQQLDPGARANIMDESRLRMTEDAYRSVFFCFPGSEVPHWFPFRCEGHSITIHRDSLDFCRNDRLIGFALCAVLQLPDTNDIEGRYILPNNDNLESYFFWRDQERKLDQDHTFLWKYNIESPGMSSMLPHALSFTFEINPYDDDPYDDDDDPYDDDEKLDQDHTFLWKYNIESPGMSMLPHALSFTFEINPYDDDPYDDDDDPYDDDDDDFWPSPSFLSIVRDIKSTVKVKECGICPLYTKEKDDDNNADAGGYSGSVRFSKNGIEEPSGSNVAWKEEAL